MTKVRWDPTILQAPPLQLSKHNYNSSHPLSLECSGGRVVRYCWRHTSLLIGSSYTPLGQCEWDPLQAPDPSHSHVLIPLHQFNFTQELYIHCNLIYKELKNYCMYLLILHMVWKLIKRNDNYMKTIILQFFLNKLIQNILLHKFRFTQAYILKHQRLKRRILIFNWWWKWIYVRTKRWQQFR